MKATVIRQTADSTHLTLDREAAHVLSAALQFTSKLNGKCQELANQLQPLLDLGGSKRKNR